MTTSEHDFWVSNCRICGQDEQSPGYFLIGTYVCTKCTLPEVPEVKTPSLREVAQKLIDNSKLVTGKNRKAAVEVKLEDIQLLETLLKGEK